MKCTRTCLVCKTKNTKEQMNRIVKLNNELVLDTDQTIQTRGCYVCKNPTCVEKIKMQKVFNRAFRQNFDEKQYDNIISEIGRVNDKSKN